MCEQLKILKINKRISLKTVHNCIFQAKSYLVIQKAHSRHVLCLVKICYFKDDCKNLALALPC